MTYNPDDFKRLTAYKNETVNVCSVCNKMGYLAEGVLCKCMKVFKYVAQLFLAGIPEEYWSIYLDSLNVNSDLIKFIHLYFDNFKVAVRKRKGLLFRGSNGVGKTAVMCEIGKYAISEGYKVKLISYPDLVDAIMRPDMQFEEELKIADIHLLDEFGKAYQKMGSDFVPSKIEQYIKSTLSTKVLIISTNYTDTDLTSMLGSSVMSAIKGSTKSITVNGDDYRDKQNDNWIKDLKTEYNYYHVNILRYANKFC